MKANIHPVWHEDVVVTCACGNSFTTAGTLPKIEVEICSNCHPFYTGQLKYIDTAGRVDAFMERQKKVQVKIVSKTEKRQLKRERKIQKELERPDTLEELRTSSAKSKNKKTS